MQIFIIKGFHSPERVKVWIKLRISFHLIIYLFKYIILKNLSIILWWFPKIKIIINFWIDIQLIKLILKFLILTLIANWKEILRLLLFRCTLLEKVIGEWVLINLIFLDILFLNWIIQNLLCLLLFHYFYIYFLSIIILNWNCLRFNNFFIFSLKWIWIRYWIINKIFLFFSF